MRHDSYGVLPADLHFSDIIDLSESLLWVGKLNDKEAGFVEQMLFYARRYHSEFEMSERQDRWFRALCERHLGTIAEDAPKAENPPKLEGRPTAAVVDAVPAIVARTAQETSFPKMRFAGEVIDFRSRRKAT